MWIAEGWEQYELIDSGGGERLERWGGHTFIRPDPQAVWPASRRGKLWDAADARYHRSDKGGGRWEFNAPVPESFVIRQDGYAFKIKPMGFKHMGLFPEQLVNWRWCGGKIREARSSGRDVKVLNLFAYTGGATVAAAEAGAFVCHVDAAKGMVEHAKENVRLSGLGGSCARYIVDDCLKFVEREIRRGSKYDAVIMDPPSYGRGPGGEVWKIESELYGLVEKCAGLLTDSPLFFIINSYTTGLSASTAENVLAMTVGARFGGSVSSAEIGIPMRENKFTLPCGSTARWASVSL